MLGTKHDFNEAEKKANYDSFLLLTPSSEIKLMKLSQWE